MITERAAAKHAAEGISRFHAVGPDSPRRPGSRSPLSASGGRSFRRRDRAQAATRDDIVGIMAAMMRPVGLGPMHEAAYPGRVDVGTLEAGAPSSAAGMAYQGRAPRRSALRDLPQPWLRPAPQGCRSPPGASVFVLTARGSDGRGRRSHNEVSSGTLRCFADPKPSLAAPRDEETLVCAPSRGTSDVDDAPTVIRYRKGSLPDAGARSVGEWTSSDEAVIARPPCAHRGYRRAPDAIDAPRAACRRAA